MHQTVDDFACTVCGCVCDDLRLTVEGDAIVQAEGACPLAAPRLVGFRSRSGPVCLVEGQPADWNAAIATSARLLRQAQAPLLFGLAQSGPEGQRAACELADWLGATIDPCVSAGQAAASVALLQVGESTCSLGEVRHRCDLVIYWGSNPVKSHPRHLERYSVDSKGRFVDGRTLVVVDVKPTETSQRADLFVQIPAGSDFDLFWALRALIAGLPVAPEWFQSLGFDAAQVVELAQRMKSCRSGVVFFGPGLTPDSASHASVEGLLRLVRELNAHTRFYARRMRGGSGAAGADNVLSWQTGFPASVNLARGFPRYGPGEYSAGALLERGEVDVCVLAGDDGLAHLSPSALERLQRMPTIYLNQGDDSLAWQPTVEIRTARHGIELAGAAYRMDDVSIPLRQVLPRHRPSDGEALAAILKQLKESQTA